MDHRLIGQGICAHYFAYLLSLWRILFLALRSLLYTPYCFVLDMGRVRKQVKR